MIYLIINATAPLLLVYLQETRQGEKTDVY